jgi:hypothetical protein
MMELENSMTAGWAPDELTSALATLGYEGFAHLAGPAQPIDPARVVAGALVHSNLDVRIVEALPWVLATYHDLDWSWLISRCLLSNIQNRLGFLVALARSISSASKLGTALEQLERSRLSSEGTLCRDSMPAAEREWVRRNRSPEAKHWFLITTLTVEQLSHAA